MQSTPSSLGPYADLGQARAAVRTALGRSPMLGLTTSAIDAMAAQARVTSWNVGDTIATEGTGTTS